MAFKLLPAKRFKFEVPVRLIYGYLDKARDNSMKKPKRDDRFEGGLLVPNDHVEMPGFVTLAREIAAESFPGRDLKTSPIRWPMQSGAAIMAKQAKADPPKKPQTMYEGQTVIRFQSPENKPPRLVVARNGMLHQFSEDDMALAGKVFYDGVKVCVSLSLKAYDGSDDGVKPGITCYINDILSLNMGEKLQLRGGDPESRWGSADKYAAYMGTVSDIDPTGDDEIPY